MDKAKVHVVAERKEAPAEGSIVHLFDRPSLFIDPTNAQYIVVHEGVVVEWIYADSYDEASALRKLKFGTLYARCGGQ